MTAITDLEITDLEITDLVIKDLAIKDLGNHRLGRRIGRALSFASSIFINSSPRQICRGEERRGSAFANVSLVLVPVTVPAARDAIGKTRIHAAGRQAAGSARLALRKAAVHALAGISDADALNAPGVVTGCRRSGGRQGGRTDGGDGHRGQDKFTHDDLLLREALLFDG